MWERKICNKCNLRKLCLLLILFSLFALPPCSGMILNRWDAGYLFIAAISWPFSCIIMPIRCKTRTGRKRKEGMTKEIGLTAVDINLSPAISIHPITMSSPSYSYTPSLFFVYIIVCYSSSFETIIIGLYSKSSQDWWWLIREGHLFGIYIDVIPTQIGARLY